MPKFLNFIYENNPSLEFASRSVSLSLLEANRYLDQTQEYIYISHGLNNLAMIVHKQAHKFLVLLDAFGDLLHTLHLKQFYPTTEEMDETSELTALNSVFSVIEKVFENVQEALEEFHKETDNATMRSLALGTEEMMLEVSKDLKKFLEIMQMFESGISSLASFDNWCGRYLED